jgi:hypothetical protein
VSTGIEDTAPRPHVFTREELADALTRLDVRVLTDGPCAGMINADAMAGAIIEALDEAGTEGKMEKGVVFKHHAGTDTATARGATRKNGGAAILKARGWYWLNSVQAYVIKDTYVTPRTAAQEVHEAAEVLRASGLTVEAGNVH